MNSNIDNYQFLEGVFRGIDPKSETIAVCAFSEPPEDRDSKGWRVYTPTNGAVNRYINPEGRPYDANTYFSIASVAPGDIINRRAESVVAVYVFPLDDIGYGPGARLPPEKVPLAPSYVIETSADNFQYGYLLDEPCHDIDRARALLKLMTKDHGDPSAPLAAKLIRLPQGYNNKRKYPTPWKVRTTTWAPEQRYSIEQIAAAFEIPLIELDKAADALAKGHGVPAQGDARDPVYDWLLHKRLVVTGPDSRGFAQIVCPWHVHHTQGDNQAAYSPMGCGGDFKDHRQFVCLHAHCQDKDVKDFLRWHFNERFYAQSDGSTIFDTLPPHIVRNPKGFDWVFSNLFWHGGPKGDTKIMYAKEWRESRLRKEVDGIGFHPGEPLIYHDPVRGMLFNTWRPFVLPVTTETHKLAPILAQIAYLFDDQYDNALGYLAHLVHKPAERVQFALLHASREHGTGRGWLKQMLHRLLGVHYCASTNLSDFMEGQFNEWLWQTRLVTFDEVRESSTRYKVQDKLRELITERRMMVNIKHGVKANIEVFSNIIMFSNHMDALAIPNEDRRIWCVGCVKPYPDQATFNQLYALLDDPEAMAQMYWYLHRHLLAFGFDAAGRAPDTAWKDVFRAGAGNELDGDIAQLVARLRAKDITCVYRNQFIALLRQEGAELPLDHSPSQQWAAFTAILRAYSVVSVGRVRLSPEALVRVPGDARSAMLCIAPDPRDFLGKLAQVKIKAACETAALHPDFDARGKLRLVTP